MGVYTALLVLTFATLSASECQREQYHNGCKIQDDTCVCEWGCKNEYIYKYRRDCRNALKKKGPATPEVQNPTAYDTLSDRIDYANQVGYIYPPTLPPQPRSSDICASLVCIRGICIQTNTNGYGFICKCEGTGYYGQRCEKACPTSPVRGVLFPHECVVI